MQSGYGVTKDDEISTESALFVKQHIRDTLAMIRASSNMEVDDTVTQ